MIETPWKVSERETESNWPGRGFRKHVEVGEAPIIVHGDSAEEVEVRAALIVQAVNSLPLLQEAEEALDNAVKWMSAIASYPPGNVQPSQEFLAALKVNSGVLTRLRAAREVEP